MEKRGTLERIPAPAPSTPPPTSSALPASKSPSQLPQERITTLAELSARLGPATEAEALVFIEGATREDLIDEGQEVATIRLDVDCARLYGIAADFFATATDGQRDAVMGVTDDLLRVAAWSAREGQQKAKRRWRALAERNAASGAREMLGEGLRESGLMRRKQLWAGLRALAGGGPIAMQRIDDAHGTGGTPEELSDALDKLIQVGREMLEDPSPGMVARRRGSRLTPAFLDGIEALSAKVRGVAAGTIEIADPGISQSEIDYWDGINLRLLRKIVDVFEAGHAADVSVPRLVPMSLRALFGKPLRRTSNGSLAPISLGADSTAEPSA